MKHAPVFAPGATIAKKAQVPAGEVHAVAMSTLGAQNEDDNLQIVQHDRLWSVGVRGRTALEQLVRGFR